jgi:hypothetical protein
MSLGYIMTHTIIHNIPPPLVPDNLWKIIAVSLTVFVVLMLIVTFLVALRRRRRKRQPSESGTSLSDMTHLGERNGMMMNGGTMEMETRYAANGKHIYTMDSNFQ